MRRNVCALLIALILLLTPTLTVTGASITVNGTCSFQNALTAANLDIAVGGCAAGSGTDTITLTGDITLTANAISLNTSAIIEGNNFAISGDDSYQILKVTKLLNQPRPALKIQNLTLKNGRANEGGAIYALHSDVVIVNSTFTDNRATTEGGAIGAYNARLTVTGSSFSGNRAEDGGAIYSQDTRDVSGDSVTISGSSFINNRVSGWNQLSGYGGAIHNSSGNLTITKSAFGNNRGNYGGAVYGAITGTIHVYNSTFYNNTAPAQNSAPTSSGLGGALYHQGNLLTVTNSTFNGNTAKNSGDTLQSLQSWTDVELYNNIVTGANGDANEHCDIDRLTQNVNNFISDGTCSAALDNDDGTLNLGALTGSPAYYPLQSGSVALDAGDSTYCVSDDIVGTSRPQGSGCDLGAFELPVSATPTATGAMMAQGVTPTATATPAPPSPPTNLRAEQGIGGIDLSWTAPAEAVDGYQILRQRPESGETAPQLVVELPIGSLSSFTDSTATSVDLYVYHVKSVRGRLYSAASNEARLDLRPTATPTDTPTITPTAIATSTPPPTETATPIPCALAEQIEAANHDRAVGTCPAGSGADIISLSKDHDLTSALPSITSEITIDGNGYSLRGNGSFTILNVSSGGNLRLNRVAILGGNGSGVGGIMNNGTLTIKSSTIAENSGGVVGGVYNAGSLKVINSTIADNTGGFVGGVLFSGGSNMELYNSLLAGNTNGDCFGGVNATSGNLIVSGSCGSAITADPLLGSLTGSPHHYPLGSDSPAIDAGASSHCPSVDQLGNARPQGAGCDIGAIEVQTQTTEPSPTATATYTLTSTDTPTLTATATDTPTDTPVPPTDTPAPTATPTPTDTPTPDPGCVSVGPNTYWLFPSSSFLSGTISIYDSGGCHNASILQQSIGSAGYVYSTSGQADAAAICTSAHDGTAHTAQQQAFNTNVYACAPAPTATATPQFQLLQLNEPTATSTPSATSPPAATSTAAAGITVNDTCSLADAITAANTDTATGGCPAGSGADTITLSGHITLPADPSDTYIDTSRGTNNVTNALPYIVSNITIEGGGYTISGDDKYRILHVSSGRVVVNNLALTRGYAHRGEGGALFVAAGAHLTVTNSSFTHTSAYWGAAIYSNGSVSVSNSVFESNEAVLHAGAIKNAIGTLSVSSSKFTDNSAHDHSGAILNGHTLTVIDSVFSGNSVNAGYSGSSGGAISSDPSSTTTIRRSTFSGNSANRGGAIRNFSSLNVSNSTFYGNSAMRYGGAISSWSSASITHSTIAGNLGGASMGGGVHNDAGTIKLRNSIVSGNTGGDCVASLSQNVNNLIQDGTCSPMLSGDPKLGTLTGSPAYYPLLADSPAKNAAHADHCPSTDQAGIARPYPAGGACDIGAIESQSASSSATITPAATDSTDTPVPATATNTQTPAMPVDPTATSIPPTPTPAPTEFCVHVSSGTYWLFPADPILDGGFLSGLITEYPSSACEDGATTQTSIGDDGYAYTTGEWIDAVALCALSDDDHIMSAAQQPLAFNADVWPCEPLSTSTPTPTGTPGPSPTSTPTAIATQTSAPTATATATDANAESCVNVSPGTHWLFPASNFLSGTTTVYSSSACDDASVTQASLGQNGYVHATAGEVMALLLCQTAHLTDGLTYSVEQLAYNTNVWQCKPPSTNTPSPTLTPPPVQGQNSSNPTATNSPAPLTTTPILPTNTPGPRVIDGLTAASNQAGELEVSWESPSQTPIDYRVSWAEDGESFKTWTDSSGNAFPTSPSYTITSLDHGVLYKVRVRARYNGSSGPWTEQVEALVMDATVEQIHQLQQQQQLLETPSDTPAPTNTPVPPTNTPTPTNTTVPPTNTPIPTDTPVPPTNTPIPTNTLVPANAKAVTNVQLSSSQPGVLEVSWDAPPRTPRDYRINWAKAGEDFPLISENIGNAFPTSPAYTITGLDEGVTYKVKLRSRYSGETNGEWTEEYQADVASS